MDLNVELQNVIKRFSNIKLLKEEVVRIISTLPPDFEDFIGICFINNYRSRNDEEIELLKELSLLHCHFTWNICTVDGKFGLPISNRIENLVGEHDYDFSNGLYTIQHYLTFLQLGYYYALCKEFDKSLEFLEIAEIAVKTGDFGVIRRGLSHVVCGNRAFVYLLKKAYDECRIVLSEIIPHGDLSNSERAGILAIYGKTLMKLGVDGSEMALIYLREALTLDPNIYQCNFYLGVALSRIRHKKFYYIEPSDEECWSLRKAVELNPWSTNVMPMIYLAQTLREKAARIGYARNSTQNELFSEVRNLCDLALNAAGNDLGAKPLVRLADMYLKLCGSFQSISNAEICIERALVLDPEDCMVNHKAATFYEYGKEDYEKALLYVEKAANERTVQEMFQAHYKVAELKTLLDPTFNAVEKLTEILSGCEDVQRLACGTYVFRGFIYYFKNEQHALAFEDWFAAFQKDPALFEMEFRRCLKSNWMDKTFHSHKKIQILINDLETRITSAHEKMMKEMHEKIISSCKIFLHRSHMGM